MSEFERCEISNKEISFSLIGRIYRDINESVGEESDDDKKKIYDCFITGLNLYYFTQEQDLELTKRVEYKVGEFVESPFAFPVDYTGGNEDIQDEEPFKEIAFHLPERSFLIIENIAGRKTKRKRPGKIAETARNLVIYGLEAIKIMKTENVDLMFCKGDEKYRLSRLPS